MQLQKTENLDLLSAEEKSALALYNESKDASIALSPHTSAQFLELFLQGYSTKDIQKMNQGFKLGLIVKARVEHDWDKYKAEYIETLMSHTKNTVQKAQLEAVRFAADGMAVYHKVLGEAFKKYLQTGNKDDLGEHSSQINIRNYREYVSLLMQLTGQDNSKKVSGEITHKVQNGPTPVDAQVIDGAELLRRLDQ